MKYSTDVIAEKIADIEFTIINEWLNSAATNDDELKIEYYKLQDAVMSKQKINKIGAEHYPEWDDKKNEYVYPLKKRS